MEDSNNTYISTKYQTVCYTFIFPTRAHRKIFLIPGLPATFKNLVTAYCKKHSAILHSIQYASCFVILTIELSLQIAPSPFMTKLKVFTSSELRGSYAKLSNMPSLWKRTLLVSTDPTPSSAFIDYFLNYEKIRKEDSIIYDL